MKADEALRRYAAGERNFRQINLRGQSFKNKNLSGANFTEADIRGADFTKANLQGTNFSGAKAGLQHHWAIFLLLVSLLKVGLAGLIAATALPQVIILTQDTGDFTILPGVIVLVVFAVFLITTTCQGLEASFWAVAGAGGVAVIAGGAVAGAGGAAVAAAGATTGAGAGAATGAVAVAIAVAITVAGTEAAVVAVAIAGVAATAAAGGVAGGAVGGVAGLSAYIGWRAIAREDKYAVVRRVALAIATTKGTSFRGANLTDANFTQAILKNVNLSNVILKHTCWFQAQKLDRAKVRGTILVDSTVQDLVVTGNGKSKSFAGLSLKGANLVGVDLRDANLTEADLSGATLQEACLERTNLTKTQALEANFNGAKLTGACLEAWNIDSTTQLDRAICDYVYLLNNQRERRPSSGEFASGEFAKLFREVLHTVDLIFRNGINREAFNYSFEKLRVENEEIELSVQGIEDLGDGVVVVRVKVPPETNKAQIHSDFTQSYEFALKAIEARYQAELKLKDEQIAIYRQQTDRQLKLLESKLDNILELGASAEVRSVGNKLVFLNVGEGDFKQGFPVTLQIGPEGTLPFAVVAGGLPPAPEILEHYSQWQTAYRSSLTAYRIKVSAAQVTNFSKTEFVKECNESAESFRRKLNSWLNSEPFRPIKERLLERLKVSESIRVILLTDNLQLRRLPWHLWDFFERYPKAEIALSTPVYERVEKAMSLGAEVRILAILGNSTGINIQIDREVLEQLPDAEVNLLVEPQRKELNHKLWSQPWDILFFAGHSSSYTDDQDGQIYINQTNSLTIAQLRLALRQAIAQRLKLAIFNSCDGLGLAQELADLHIPQIIFMREPVPDQVAQEFLKNFLAAFTAGESLYLSVRKARERLQGLEDEFPCATWLPVICQNPAEVPKTWQEFRGI